MAHPASTRLPAGSVAVVLGTRPEIIKLAPVIERLGPAASIIHTGQHFDAGLSQVFFDTFTLPEPSVFLGIGGETRGAQIGLATARIDEQLETGSFRVVVVQGDTNSALGGALAANARELPLVHVEAGLRSFDRRMPEEHNRVLIDHLSDVCAAPTETNRTNLESESIPSERIRVTGNTIVEAVTGLLPTDEHRARVRNRLQIPEGPFILSTFHRPENVDEPETLRTILTELANLPLPVVLPLHPRTRLRIAADPDSEAAAAQLEIVDPIPYSDFIGLAGEAAVLVSDSGGLQEEASVVKRPILVVRRSTERPEVIGTFAERVLPGSEISQVVGGWLQDLPAVHSRLNEIPTPYGDRSAADQICLATIEVADA